MEDYLPAMWGQCVFGEEQLSGLSYLLWCFEGVLSDQPFSGSLQDTSSWTPSHHRAVAILHILWVNPETCEWFAYCMPSDWPHMARALVCNPPYNAEFIRTERNHLHQDDSIDLSKSAKASLGLFPLRPDTGLGCPIVQTDL